MVFKIDTKEAVIEILYQIKNKALNDIIRYPTRTGTCSRVAFMSSFTIFFFRSQLFTTADIFSSPEK